MKEYVKGMLKIIYSFFPPAIKQKLSPRLNLIKKRREINFVKVNDISKKNLNPDFVSHEKLIRTLYGKIEDDFCISVLPEKILEEILDYLKIQKQLSSKEIFQRYKESISDDRKLMCTDTSSYGEKLIKDNAKIFKSAWELDHKNVAIINLQKFIQKEFKNYFKSPIIFLNSRAWALPPQSKSFGANNYHLDGFEDGHLKIMIYPFGLSEKFGKLIVEEKEITNRKKGTLVAFKNSEVVHKSVPGTEKDRIAIEITIMRSLIPSLQQNKSHFNGRHFYSIKDSYESF